MFHHILVTTDGSPLAQLALPVAADLARRYGASLTLLYVAPLVPLGVFTEGAAYTFDPAERERMRAAGTSLLEEARQTIDFPEARLVCREPEGQATAQVIADEVGREGADLVVMSTHGRGGLAHFFLGSVAEAVVRQVRVPVFLVRAPAAVARTEKAAAQEVRS